MTIVIKKDGKTKIRLWLPTSLLKSKLIGKSIVKQYLKQIEKNNDAEWDKQHCENSEEDIDELALPSCLAQTVEKNFDKNDGQHCQESNLAEQQTEQKPNANMKQYLQIQKQMYRAIKQYKKENGTLTLIDVKAVNGDHVLIKL